MKHRIETLSAGRAFAVETEGPFRPERFRGVLGDLLRTPGWAPGSPLILDFRKTDLTRATAEELRVMADAFSKRNAEIGSAKVALLAATPADFGVLRMFAAAAEGEVDSEFAVFHGREEALEWVLS